MVKGEDFKNLSTDAKLLYGLLLDRMGLSMKNGWHDSQGRVFIYYPVEEVEEDLNCGHGKAVKLMAELDSSTGIGLIERVRQGLCRPSIIYVKRFASKPFSAPPHPPSCDDDGSTKIELPEVQKANLQTSDNQTSRGSIIIPPEVQKSDIHYNDKNYLDNNYLYQSIYQSNQPIDGIDRNICTALVREQIGYEAFATHSQSEVDELVMLITDVLCSSQVTFRIGGTQFKSKAVKERLSNLQQCHIEYVLDCMKKNTTKVRNIRGYLLTVLYNAPTTMEHYYQASVQHDLYGQQADKPKRPP